MSNVQITCDSCLAKYNFPLPPAILQKPDKSMSFKCAGCGYRFQIQPENILNQDAVAQNIILVKSDKLAVHDNLQEVVDKVESGVYSDTDTVRIFGQPWQFISEADELQVCFQESEVPNVDEHVPVPEEDVTPIEDSLVEDIGLDFDESVSTEMSEIDPFSEADEIASTTEPEASQDDDWVIEEDVTPDERVDDEVAFETEPVEDFATPVTDDTPFPSMFPEPDTPFPSMSPDTDATIQETSDVEPTSPEETDVLDDFVVEEQVDNEDISFELEWSEEEIVEEVTESQPTELSGNFEDFTEELDLEGLQANLLEELDLDSEDTVVSPIASSAPSTEPMSPTPEHTMTATPSNASASSGGTADFMSDYKRQLLAEPEIESEEIDGEEIFSATPEVGDVDEEPQDVQPKAKQRLSFSNKVPEVPKSNKVDINPMYVFAAIIFFSIGVLGYILFQGEMSSTEEYNGLATNSDRLQQTDEEVSGLRENDNENSEREIIGEPETEVVTDGSLQQEDGNGTDSTSSLAQATFPQVLPDVQAESLDYAKDRSPTELTRMGYQALYQDKDPDLAIRYFQLALKKDSSFTDAEFGLGKAHEARGEEDLAVEHICKSSIEQTQYRLNSVLQLGRDCL